MAGVALFLVAFYFSAACAMYEDQAGDFDWYQQYVGPVSYLSLDGVTSQGCKRLLVASERGVVAAIDARTGDIKWRHVYEKENGAIDVVLKSKWGLVTVSRGGQVLRCWDSLSGVLKWEAVSELATEGKQLVYPLNTDWRPGAVVGAMTGQSLGTIAVAMGTKVVGFTGRSGDKLWSTDLEMEEEAFISYIQSTDTSLHLLTSVQNLKLYVHTLNPATGKIESKVEIPAPWLSWDTTNCAMAGSTVACLDRSQQIFYHTSGERFTLVLLEELGIAGAETLEAGEDDTFWVHSDHSHWLLHIHDNAVSITTKTSHTLSLQGSLNKESVGVRVQFGEKWVQLGLEGEREEEEELGGKVFLADRRGKPVQADVHLSQQKGQHMSYQLVLVMEDLSIVFIQSPGEVLWQREEGLATAVAVEILDLPPTGQSEAIENFIMQTKGEKNPLILGLLRLQLQLVLAKDFIKGLQSRGLPNLLHSSDELTRDQFNTRKMIVVATETGKLYGLDSNSGRVLWQDIIPNIAPLVDGTFLLHLLRTTSHPPYPPLSVLIGVSKGPSCEGYVLHAFNPLTGDHMTVNGDHVRSDDSHVTTELQCLGRVKQMLLLPQLDHTHSHILLVMTDDMQLHPLPNSPEVTHLLSTITEQLFLYVADMESGQVTGYHLAWNEDQSLTGVEAWHTLYPTEYEQIVSVVTKPHSEHVSSPGRVKADRSIQYKYLNPHTFAVVTEGEDGTAGEKSFFTIYLIDGVTGATIYHTTHRNAKGPVQLVLSENWIVYHYYSTKLRRHELAVIELHEQPTNHTHTVWSSLSPPSPPEVTYQAYTFPTALRTLTTTQTMKGITHKSLLMGLHSGHIVSLSKRFLDPRRHIIPTEDMKEDGLPLYSPQVLLNPVMYINYNQTVSGLHHIHVATSGLESTCLVFACGLDLYFTRVTPSKQFDLLAEDFDYPLITAIILGLVVGTVVLSYFASRKSLLSLWK